MKRCVLLAASLLLLSSPIVDGQNSVISAPG